MSSGLLDGDKYVLYLRDVDFTMPTDYHPNLTNTKFANDRIMRRVTLLPSYRIIIEVNKGCANAGADYSSKVFALFGWKL